MTWQISIFSITYFISAVMVLAAIIFAYRHITVRGARYFIYLTFSVEIWALFMGLEYGVVEPAWKIIFAKIEYFGIATIGTTWLLFALNYSRREKWLTRRNIVLMLIIPLVTLLLVFTNETHKLVWPVISTASDHPGAGLVYGHGPAFWLIFIYNYITLSAGTIIIIHNAFRARDLYRWQMFGLTVSAIIPWVGNLIYISGANPFPTIDLTPIGFSLSALVITFNIFRFGLFDLVPIARDQLVENLIDGMLALDNHNRIADINPKARDLLKITSGYVIGHPILEFPSAWELLRPFEGVESAQVETKIKQSTITDVELRISPLAGENGRLAGRLFIIRDISERKQLEKMRNDLTHAMVHDLRNPLAIIMLSLDILKIQLSTAMDEEQLITFETAEQSTQQIMGLVNSILDINRLESKQMPLKRSQVFIQKIGPDALRTQTLIAQNKHILLQEKIAPNLLPVMVDEELMKRVLQNLLDNAVKFSPEDGLVTITAAYSIDGRCVIISVSDTGAGLEPEIKNRLFEKFFTGNVKNGGSGLGLAFCRLVVEAHGGKIWVEETGPTGTTISLSIPA